MALNSTRPITCSFLYPPTCRIPVRTFTSTAKRARAGVSSVKQRSEPAMSVVQKKQMLNLDRHSDFGLLDDTLVMPTGSRLPALLKEPGKRARLEWLRLKKRGMDLFTILNYKWGVVKGPVRPRIDFGKTKTAAKTLHQNMYSAFAEGDKIALGKMCAKGLLASFTAKINGRGRQERYVWKAEKYIGQPKVVSHRAALLPAPPMTTLRQAVVRIRSRQILEKIDGKTREQVSAKDMDEYLVIQKFMIQGSEGDWIVWGTTHESDPSTLLVE